MRSAGQVWPMGQSMPDAGLDHPFLIWVTKQPLGMIMMADTMDSIVLIALSRCNRVFTRRLRLCHSHTVYRRVVRKGGREGPNRVESEV